MRFAHSIHTYNYEYEDVVGLVLAATTVVHVLQGGGPGRW